MGTFRKTLVLLRGKSGGTRLGRFFRRMLDPLTFGLVSEVTYLIQGKDEYGRFTNPEADAEYQKVIQRE